MLGQTGRPDEGGLPRPPHVTPETAPKSHMRPHLEQSQIKPSESIPDHVQAILQKPGHAWSPEETDQVFEWLMAQEFTHLTGFASRILRAKFPWIDWQKESRLGDFVSEAIFNGFKYSRNFDPLKGNGKFMPWFYAILRNYCTRAGGKVAGSIEANDGNILPWVAAPAAFDPDRWASTQRIEAAIRSLPDPYREALCLHHIDGMSLKEVALAQGIQEGNAKVRVFRARDLLKDRLEEEEQIDRVPSPFRQALILHHYRGTSYDEIAHRQKISGATATARVSQAWQLMACLREGERFDGLPEPHRSVLGALLCQGMSLPEVARRQDGDDLKVIELITTALEMLQDRPEKGKGA